MKKTVTVLCILAVCVLLVGWFFFWKNQKHEDKKQVEYFDPCVIGWWHISLWEFWNICVFEDGSFCSAVSFMNWECKQWDKFEEVKYSENESLLYCPADYEPVCWEDGKVYMNSCILERHSLVQSKTLKVVKWACVPMNESEIAALNVETWSVETWSIESWDLAE